MMASFPEAVDMARLPADHGDFWGLDPRLHASAAEGERMYTLVAQETAKLVGLALQSQPSGLHNQAYVHAANCWQDCQNLRDLEDGYWQGDERWEDPYCWFCEWRSPGLMAELLALQGAAWLERTLAHWRELSRPYTTRAKFAMEQIELEYARLNM